MHYFVVYNGIIVRSQNVYNTSKPISLVENKLYVDLLFIFPIENKFCKKIINKIKVCKIEHK